MKFNKKFGIVATLVVIANLMYAEVPSGYYSSLEGLCGSELKTAVKQVAHRNFVQIPYGTKSTACTWQVFLESDTYYDNGTRYWWDMYSYNVIAAPDRYTRGDMNIEHAVPNSWWGGDSSIDAYVDLFHLNPSDPTANNHKGNYPLGIVASLTDVNTWYNDGYYTIVGAPRLASCGGATYVFEPADEYKGDFARAYFYIFTSYDDIAWRSSGTNWMYDTRSPLTLKPWAYDMLLEWAERDPVSQKEIDRNESIAKNQGNRNPFIDCPDLAKYIWGEYRNTPFSLSGTDRPVADDNKGYWKAVTTADELTEEDKYIAVSTTNHMALSMYAPTYDTPYYLMECYKSPVFDASDSKKIAGVPDDIAVLTLEKDGSKWRVSVSDRRGINRGYLTSSEAKKMNLIASPEDNAIVTITPTSSKTDIFFNAAAAYLKYNNYDSGRRFTTYASGQENILLYRYVEDNSETNPDDNNGDGKDNDPDLIEYEITEDFTLANSGLPMGSANKPSVAKTYTSKTTGITYSIMGCYVNNYESPYYLLVNGKNNEGAFISFSLDKACRQIKLTTTSGCSINSNSAVNVYADNHLIGKYGVNAQNSIFTIDVPEEYRSPGIVYKIESATTAYNQQFAGFTYVCDISAAINNVWTDSVDGEFIVYNLQGVKLNINSQDELNRLAPGLYIVNGKKLLIK